MKFFNFFIFFVGNFCPPGSGSTDLIETRSDPDSKRGLRLYCLESECTVHPLAFYLSSPQYIVSTFYAVHGLCVCLFLKWSCNFQATSSLSSRTTRTRLRRWPPPTTSSWTSSTPSLSTSSQVQKHTFSVNFALLQCSIRPHPDP